MTKVGYKKDCSHGQGGRMDQEGIGDGEMTGYSGRSKQSVYTDGVGEHSSIILYYRDMQQSAYPLM